MAEPFFGDFDLTVRVGRIGISNSNGAPAFENPKRIAKAILKLLFCQAQQLRGKRN